jgi:hypothetical protein
MPTTDWRVAFVRRAFLRHAPRHYAVMLALDATQRLRQKYIGRRGAITDTMIARHLEGTLALAAPAAVNSRANLLPLDIDAGGLDAIHTLLALAQQRSLWAFGQYTPRLGLAHAEQRGYVWLPFDAFVETERLQLLGAQLIAALDQPLWKIEARATHAVTRLPLARHTHTRRFGELVLGDQRINIDDNPLAALAALRAAYHENSSDALPPLPPAPIPRPRPATSWGGNGISIDRYNQNTDLATLLQRYGARPSGRRNLFFCSFHADERASLSVYTHHGQQYCCCFSAHSDCPLAQHRRNDAFNVYCIGEGLDSKAALQRLNGKRLTPKKLSEKHQDAKRRIINRVIAR